MANGIAGLITITEGKDSSYADLDFSRVSTQLSNSHIVCDCLYVCVSACTCTSLLTLHFSTASCTYVRTYVCMYKYVVTYTHIMYVHNYVCVYYYYTHTHIYSYPLPSEVLQPLP